MQIKVDGDTIDGWQDQQTFIQFYRTFTLNNLLIYYIMIYLTVLLY